MARIPYVDREDLPPEHRPLLDTVAVRTGGEGGEDGEEGEDGHGLPSESLNIHRALGNHPGLLGAFREYASALWNEGGLDPVERELVILTTARAIRAEYEWHQHVRVALDEGIDAVTIRAVSTGETGALAPEHAALVEYVRRFVDGQVDAETHDALAEHYEPDTLVGITLLSGFYLGLGRTLDAFDVETEVPFVGWGLEDL